MKIYPKKVDPRKAELIKKLTGNTDMTPQDILSIINTAKEKKWENVPISERAILSIYDYTGAWAQPYIDAGYPVLLWDYKVEGCIFKYGLSYLQTGIYKSPYDPDAPYQLYGLLAAPPCTDFANSGAQWWAQKDKSTKRAGENEEFENSVDQHTAMVEIIELFVEWFSPKFWVAENPRGRLEKLVPQFKNYRAMKFNPCDFGDPYTKETYLYGNFNTNLPLNQVEPTEGSKMHKMSSSWKTQRSATPPGFAKAFFQANQ